jgi:hypothetical protein
MAATDPQRGAAGGKGGHAASPSASRRAELGTGRHTNARPHRRDAQQADVDDWLGPNGPGARLDTWTRDPEGIPQSPGAPCDPPHNATQRPGTAEHGPRSPAPEPANALREQGATACEASEGWSQKPTPLGEPEERLTETRYRGRYRPTSQWTRYEHEHPIDGWMEHAPLDSPPAAGVEAAKAP